MTGNESANGFRPAQNSIRSPDGASRNELEFQRFLEKLPAAAYTCDIDGHITYFNRHAVELWGREPQLNDPADRFCGSFKLAFSDGTPVEHSRCWMALALQDGKEYNGRKIIIERPDGSRCSALAHVNPIHNELGEVIGAVNVVIDISARKQAEDILKEADRRKTQFLAMLAHELRNPLAPIRNGLQIVRLANNDHEVMEQARGMMERQVGQMARLIEDLFDLSRITTGKLKRRNDRFDLLLAVQDALETSRPCIDAARHELTVILPNDPIFVDGDRGRLAQVFANLLNNSAKFTDDEGQIWLKVERHGSDVIVKIRDNGAGILPHNLEKIFDLIMQSERMIEQAQCGLGIGLNLVRGLVEMHGGRVEAHSDGPGKGAEFTVRLPVMLQYGKKQHTPSDKVLPTSHYRILVVDDNKDSAKTLAMTLKLMGHTTRVAHDGLETLMVAEEFLPHIVLLDIGLPKLNGYDVCRHIRKQRWGDGMVLIALTGWSQDEDKLTSKEAGFNFHLVKPIDFASLGKLLDGLLSAPV
jgi:PAS domain S-box-containing protein